MAIFHFSARIISRGKGQSAIAAAAYRSGERLRDEQAGEQKFYAARSERIIFTAIMAPKDAPEWAYDRNRLWNEAERAEKRKDAQLAREIEVSLPHELTDRQREFLIKDFAREAFVRKGFAVDIAIHAPDRDSDTRNFHAHLMVTRRALGPDGFAPTKDWQFDKRQLGQWREQWAHLANRHLERHGHGARIDHRSLEGQGIGREPTVHVGYAAAEMTQRGAPSDRMDALKEVLARNEQRIGLERNMAAITRELQQLTELQQEEQRAHALAAARALVARREEADRQAAMESLRRAALKDERKLEGPAEKAFGQAARAEASHVRQARKSEQAETRQVEWREQTAARQQAAEAPKPVQNGLQVFDAATGGTSRLADFMLDLLAGPRPAARKPDMKALINDPEARKRHQLASLAASRQAKHKERALERIGDDLKAGRNLKADDVRSLSREQQEQIRSFGDAAVQQMVDSARKRDAEYWRGDERERER